MQKLALVLSSVSPAITTFALREKTSVIVACLFCLVPATPTQAQNPTEQQITRFFETVRKGDLETVKSLVRHNPRLIKATGKDEEGRIGSTALHIATAEARKEVVKLLVERGANVNAVDTFDHTPLHEAVLKGNVTIIAALLAVKAVNVDAKCKHGMTPLLLAARAGKAEIVKLLCDRGADLEAKDPRQMTALMWAAASGHTSVVETLVEQKADAHARDKPGFTALHFAAERGHADVVRVLADNGADVDTRSDDQLTALHSAAQNGHVDAVMVLLAHQVSVDAKDRSGMTPLGTTASNFKVDEMKCVAVMNLLLQHNANIDATDRRGRTALWIAAALDRGHVAKFLLAKSADVDVEDELGGTALHIAALQGAAKVTRLLLHNANAKAENKRGRTSLHYAALCGKERRLVLLGAGRLKESSLDGFKSVIELLLQHEAALDATDKDGHTALWYAEKGGRAYFAKFLLSKSPAVGGKGKGKGKGKDDAQAGQPVSDTRSIHLPKGQKQVSVPLHFGPRGLYLEATFHGSEPLLFLVDTGSSRSAIDRGVATRLGLHRIGLPARPRSRHSAAGRRDVHRRRIHGNPVARRRRPERIPIRFQVEPQARRRVTRL